MYVCMYACMYVCMYVCMFTSSHITGVWFVFLYTHECFHVHMHLDLYIHSRKSKNVSTYIHTCIYAHCTFSYIHVLCVYSCMHVGICLYVCTNLYMIV